MNNSWANRIFQDEVCKDCIEDDWKVPEVESVDDYIKRLKNTVSALAQGSVED